MLNTFDWEYSFNELIQVNKKQSVRITSRDLEILEFILSMKFSSIEDIHLKFFKVTRSGEESTSLRWARERVNSLKDKGFVQTLNNVCNKSLFLITKKGYQFLKNCNHFKLQSAVSINRSLCGGRRVRLGRALKVVKLMVFHFLTITNY